MAISGSKSKISLKPKNVKSNLSSTYVKRLKIALLKKKENSRSVQPTIPHSASKVKLKDKKPIAIDARQRLESAHFRLFNIIVFIIWILLNISLPDIWMKSFILKVVRKHGNFSKKIPNHLMYTTKGLKTKFWNGQLIHWIWSSQIF